MAAVATAPSKAHLAPKLLEKFWLTKRRMQDLRRSSEDSIRLAHHVRIDLKTYVEETEFLIKLVERFAVVGPDPVPEIVAQDEDGE